MSCGPGLVWGPHRGHHYWPAQVLHQVGGECVVQWYGDHRVDTVRHSVLSMFPILSPGVPTRRSVRGKNALEKAIVEATKEHPFLQHQQSQTLQPNEDVQFTSDGSNHVVNVPVIGQGSGQTYKLLHIQNTPPLDPQYLIMPQVNQLISEDRKNATGRVQNFSKASSILAGQSSPFPQEPLSQLSSRPIPTKRKRRRR